MKYQNMNMKNHRLSTKILSPKILSPKILIVDGVISQLYNFQFQFFHLETLKLSKSMLFSYSECAKHLLKIMYSLRADYILKSPNCLNAAIDCKKTKICGMIGQILFKSCYAKQYKIDQTVRSKTETMYNAANNIFGSSIQHYSVTNNANHVMYQLRGGWLRKEMMKNLINHASLLQRMK